MSIQTRKLVLIEEFLRISDESLIAKIESFIKNEKKISHENNLKPMSLDDFHNMIEQSNQDSEAGQAVDGCEQNPANPGSE